MGEDDGLGEGEGLECVDLLSPVFTTMSCRRAEGSGRGRRGLVGTEGEGSRRFGGTAGASMIPFETRAFHMRERMSEKRVVWSTKGDGGGMEGRL